MAGFFFSHPLDEARLQFVCQFGNQGYLLEMTCHYGQWALLVRRSGGDNLLTISENSLRKTVPLKCARVAKIHASKVTVTLHHYSGENHEENHQYCLGCR